MIKRRSAARDAMQQRGTRHFAAQGLGLRRQAKATIGLFGIYAKARASRGWQRFADESLRYDSSMRLLTIVMAAIALQGCGRSTPEPVTRQVRIAVSRDAINWLPIYLAQKLGYCQKEGVDLTVSDVAGVSKAAEALLGGSADVAGGSLMMTIQLAAQGRSVQTFLTLYTVPSWALVVAPAANGSIHAITDLKGHRVGVSSLGSPSHTYLNYALASHGLAPEDVSTVSIGTGATSVAAVEHGQVDAAALVGSAITALELRHQNLTLLADARTPNGSREVFGSSAFPVTALLAQEQWLRTNPDTARRLVRAVKRAMQWMGEQTAERILAEIPPADRMPDTQADLEAIRYAQQALSRDGVLPADAPETVRKILALASQGAQTTHIDLSKTYTNEFAAAK
jgi:NitT/TauT family transport system substrate-binding protein